MAAVSAPNIAPERPVDRTPSRVVRAARLKAEWKSLTALDGTDIARWRELAGRALEPNVFLEPAFATAALGLPEAHGIGAMMVRSGARLLGFLPGRIGAWTTCRAPSTRDSSAASVQEVAPQNRRAGCRTSTCDNPRPAQASR